MFPNNSSHSLNSMVFLITLAAPTLLNKMELMSANIMKMRLSMLALSKLPKTFWVESFLTVASYQQTSHTCFRSLISLLYTFQIPT